MAALEPGASRRLLLQPRQVPRLKVRLPFELEDGWRGEVVDLSAGGLRLECIAVLEPLRTVEGTLHVGGERLPIRGVVVWVEPPDHALSLPAEVGLELLESTPAYLAALAALFAAAP